MTNLKLAGLQSQKGDQKWIRDGDAEAELPIVPERMLLFFMGEQNSDKVPRRKILYDP
jgi:hypothetical protein